MSNNRDFCSNLYNSKTKLRAVSFDCDSTLAKIDGIVRLARAKGIEKQIEKMTEALVSKALLSSDLYGERFRLVSPSQSNIEALGATYYTERTKNVAEVISLLSRLGKEIYIVSAGILPAVRNFAAYLGVKKENVYAVDIRYDSSGKYLSFDESSPLPNNTGKRKIIAPLVEKWGTVAHIGDGSNDIVVKDLVTRFIGYGGVSLREEVCSASDFFIYTEDLAQVLPFLLTSEEAMGLKGKSFELYRHGYNSLVMNDLKRGR